MSDRQKFITAKIIGLLVLLAASVVNIYFPAVGSGYILYLAAAMAFRRREELPR